MQAAQKKAGVLLVVASICFLAHAISFALMPYASNRQLATGEQGPSIAAGSLFWAGLALGWMFFALTNHVRRRSADLPRGALRRYGLFRFFSNLPAIVADVLAAAAVIGSVLCFVFQKDNQLVFCMLALSVFSIYMHALLNGVNFRFVTTGGTAT